MIWASVFSPFGCRIVTLLILDLAFEREAVSLPINRVANGLPIFVTA
ncbi:Hypothetical protein ADU70_1225 [Pediococcus damnosus]|uniref:Uncharacterized protein n=1 Tax=Pediococcus damnosus TaxID=51663 RepID=A0AAC9B1W7_9LACO|nr:Hypothetical protein ADU70_1225 [Pediococcus damnosus]